MLESITLLYTDAFSLRVGQIRQSFCKVIKCSQSARVSLVRYSVIDNAQITCVRKVRLTILEGY